MKRTTFVRRVGIPTCLAFMLVVSASPASKDHDPQFQQGVDCSTVNDETIRANIIAELNTYIPPLPGLEKDFHIGVKKGVVEVEGEVESSGVERAVIHGIERVPCVRDLLTKDLEVDCNDAKALENANSLLQMLPCAVKERITVTVRRGVATLNGAVPSVREKRRAANMVEVADCVKEVRNRIAVEFPRREPVNCGTITPADLKKLVEASIRSRVSCGAANSVVVNVAGRIVTLTGTVNFSAREAIVSAAADVSCVTRVRDEMGEQGPGCPAGSINCRTLEGEEWCCFGCRQCPAQ